MTLSSYGLTRLVLTEFRNYKSAQLKCDVRPVVLTGDNGIGKTNILEAISFLSPGRGLRRAKLSDVRRSHGHDPLFSQSSPRLPALCQTWGVAVTLSTPQGDWDIGTGLEIQDNKERRVVKVNSALLKSQTRLNDYLHVLWLTPQMDRLFQEGASTRRRFLDRLVYGLDSDHASRVTRYEHYMRERSHILKNGGRDLYWLDALESKMSAEGIAICVARLQFIERLLQTRTWTLNNFPQADMALSGEIESFLLKSSALESEDQFKALLKKSRAYDRESGHASFGPHRSNFSIIYRTKNRDASSCSTGEQKALLISVIFATARLQRLQEQGVPLMLLDEVIAHLDEEKREALFDEILALKTQAWMTGTDLEMFKSFNNKVQHFQIENGIIRPKKN